MTIQPPNTFFYPIFSELIKGNHFRINPKAVYHFYNCIDHHGGPAKVIFDFVRIFMGTEVIVVKRLVDMVCHPIPVVFWLGVGKGNMELKIFKRIFKMFEFIIKKQFQL